jgi:tRNA(fMet)-specific endonuclease VapC
MSLYMLDTDISSYIIKENDRTHAEKIMRRESDHICISSVTYAELRFGALKKGSEKLNLRIKNFFSLVHIIDLGPDAADEYAKIRLALEKKGKPIGNLDMFIASCALAIGAVLVTNNKRHFSLIPGLSLENWLR